MAIRAIESGDFETVQFPLNLLYPDAIERIVPAAKAHDVGLIAMKPFAGGRLEQFDNIVPDPGIEKPEEIEEIIGIAESREWGLIADDLEAIERIREEVGTVFCRRCGYCTPCPQGWPLFR